MTNTIEKKDTYAAVKLVYSDGDWVIGTDKHIGCSLVFDCDTNSPQPFSYLDETDPKQFRIATSDEIAKAGYCGADVIR